MGSRPGESAGRILEGDARQPVLSCSSSMPLLTIHRKARLVSARRQGPDRPRHCQAKLSEFGDLTSVAQYQRPKWRTGGLDR